MGGKGSGRPFTGASDPRRSTGAYPGHAPTSDGMHLAKLNLDPNFRNFAHPEGRKNLRQGGHTKTKEHRCLEEIQNRPREDVGDPAWLESMKARYPPRLVDRLLVMMTVAEDPDHPAWRYAVLEIREILNYKHSLKQQEDPVAPAGATIKVFRGTLTDVPLPGTALPPAEEESEPK